jgi:hypothetical protein
MRRMAIIIGLAMGLAACAKSPSTSVPATASLVFLTRDGCANSPKMLANLAAAIRALPRPVDYQVIDQWTLARSDVRAAYPTPTLLYGNRDLFGLAEPKPPYPEPT